LKTLTFPNRNQLPKIKPNLLLSFLIIFKNKIVHDTHNFAKLDSNGVHIFTF
jgi:hypothetical protein